MRSLQVKIERPGRAFLWKAGPWVASEGAERGGSSWQQEQQVPKLVGVGVSLESRTQKEACTPREGRRYELSAAGDWAL